jgi:hypothetical protein
LRQDCEACYVGPGSVMRKTCKSDACESLHQHF